MAGDMDERLQALAKQDQLFLADWVEITGAKMDKEGKECHYKITKEGVRFVGWPDDFMRDFQPLEQAEMLRQNEAPGLTFPCTPNELVDFIDSDAGSMFGNLFVPEVFRNAVKSPTASALAANGDAARLDSAIDRNKVMAYFTSKADPDENRKFWDDKLSSPPKWLIGARAHTGRAGTSALWCPLLLAHALLGRKYMTRSQLDVVMNAHFPELDALWKEQTEDER